MIIITAVGDDRPGMAHALAHALAEAGCNIEDTTMTRLSGEFAMILIVSPPPGLSRDGLAARLARLEASHELFINCKTIAPAPDEPEADLARWILSVYGPERGGLVAAITGVLATHGANITDVQTRVAAEGALYIMLFEIEVPPAFDIQALQAALEAAAREIGAQMSLHPLEAEQL